MFNNARTYNQEVFHSTLESVTAETGLPGASPALGGPSSSAAYDDSALRSMDEDERPRRGRARSAGRKQVISDDEYLTLSVDE
ncbi:uncharacterized protein F5891DRAFT_1180289 [Suillus fuscotomentosus]|uniref:Uncharacterized protein n=1 Tax=Suillus fuscotomentosus TaxID=1912939 RepID=A0AAD4HSQ9_9AGAM|nr:uncharacterized protein F5891DRAFT_1180289 [Suillus fuscotomentosus]KAG1908745.1 hypothetical protein F5891DRAFT_1180289 [Suillus fuscotomentosus]